MKKQTIPRTIGNTPCRIPGCAAPPFKNHQAECTHYHRVHSGRIRVPKEKRKRRSSIELAFNGNGHTPKVTRPYKRRKNLILAQQSEQPVTHQAEVKFCPQCGTDMIAVATALILRGQTKPIIGCPCCLIDLRNVATGMVTAKG